MQITDSSLSKISTKHCDNASYCGFSKHHIQKWLLPFHLCVPSKGMKGLCSSQQVPAGLVCDAVTGSPAQSPCMACFSYNHYLQNKSFFSPFSSFISAQHSIILAPGNVSDQACPARSKARCGWS